MTLPRGVRAVLIDIEGTTTPISFVYEVLFPFAEARLATTCARAGNEPGVAAALEQLRSEHRAEPGGEVTEFGDGSDYARRLMAQNSKSTGLKALQGLIWSRGYHSGELRGQLFEDVPDALRVWRSRGIRLRAFSSGSVLAQRLLFGYSDHGDLTGLFEGFHDTTTGAKCDASAYEAIHRAFDLPPGSILFLSDVVEELDAAKAADMRTGLIERPGNAAVAAGPHEAFRSFAELADP